MGTESIPKNILNKSDGSNSFVSVIGAGFYFKRRFIGDTYWYSVVKLPCVSVGSMSTDSFFLFSSTVFEAYLCQILSDYIT